MTSIKQKLIEALDGLSLDEVDTQGLADVLLVRLENKDKEIKRLHHANAEEARKLYEERESLHRGINDIRQNPHRLFYSQKFFIGRGGHLIRVEMERGRMRLTEIVDGNDWISSEVDWQTWEKARVETYP